MDVWSGSIVLDGDRPLEGFRLIDPSSRWPCDISKSAKLHLRSFVNPSLIPLHARAGPGLELHIINARTSQWLQRKLTGCVLPREDDFDLHQSLPCPVGLLVSIEDSPIKKTSMATSDLLVYGVLSGTTSCTRPPTPPHSSPSKTDSQATTSPNKPHELRIYAAPLSTSLLAQAHTFPSPPSSSDGGHVSTQAEFLPQISSLSPKRKRVATLFEIAAQHHRRVRQRGGEAVSQIMAPSRPQSSSQNFQSLRVKREPEDEPPGFTPFERITAHRSRSVSIGANLCSLSTGRSMRAGVTDLQKRASVSNLSLDTDPHRIQQLQSSVLLSTSSEPKLPSMSNLLPKTPESIISENKNVITRTILTCMRLYGFHRSNMRCTASKHAIDPSLTPHSTPIPPDVDSQAQETYTDDDEFKDLYHITYKAAAFALRRYLKSSSVGAGSIPVLLQKEKAMTCIDDLLRIFCEGH
ncbi:hypothetical protein N7495_002973 [Penicillium taxi]|uniref:uncharacterized protein n=1 Tax=Penicillium taxi TaxID=168475 RepID=UPI0025457AA5|nr:uncharacterized protein N7495_002973 [Penicillium taxi]KAJ5902445.1 hypothetical protein N7495_002973 [Penicillium taxi]